MIGMLRTLPPEHKGRWPEMLPELVQAYNATPHASTGFAPFFLMFGREPRLPVDELLPNPETYSASGPSDWVRHHQLRLQAAHHRAFTRFQQRAAERVGRTDVNAQEHPLNIGDIVYLRQRRGSKLQDRWDTEPHQVTKRMESNYSVRPVRGGDELNRRREELLLVGTELEEPAPEALAVPGTPEPVLPTLAPEPDEEMGLQIQLQIPAPRTAAATEPPDDNFIAQPLNLAVGPDRAPERLDLAIEPDHGLEGSQPPPNGGALEAPRKSRRQRGLPPEVTVNDIFLAIGHHSFSLPSALLALTALILHLSAIALQ